MRKFFPYILILFLLSAAGFFFLFRSKPTQFSEVVIEGKFSIPIPEYLSKTDSIDATSLLQYRNVKENIFLVVYEEADTTHPSLHNFFKKFSADFISHIERGTLLKYYPEKINGHNALIGNIRGHVNETKVYYRIAVVESASGFYEIIFGAGDNNRSSYDEDMDKTIKGFKIIS